MNDKMLKYTHIDPSRVIQENCYHLWTNVFVSHTTNIWGKV